MDSSIKSHLREERDRAKELDLNTEGAHMARNNPFDPHAHATSCDLFTGLQTEVGPNG